MLSIPETCHVVSVEYIRFALKKLALNNFRETGTSTSGYSPFFSLLNIQSMPLSSKCDFCIKLT
jgi:hypothetical protein